MNEKQICQAVASDRVVPFHSGFNLHPALQPAHDPVLVVLRHAVYQPGPQALVKVGDELRQILQARALRCDG